MHCRAAHLLLIATLTGLLVGPSAAKTQNFYAIAHMTNSIETVGWAVGQGANGIEADLRFDPATQQPTVFQHSIGDQPCDCSCGVGMGSESSVCSHLHGGII